MIYCLEVFNTNFLNRSIKGYLYLWSELDELIPKSVQNIFPESYFGNFLIN